ncbi:hypothetical protein Pmani_007961 [Petrolisthes manimaculis]|uniref:Uncharacterized protein n=1 Tax=Petrolisthes manimaculis TaxID=1843537 RepID=A0AAE1Q9V7_9EUCA|nr:hypothetical protein Pmani_007961 [Petrolisthes manimaculis]
MAVDACDTGAGAVLLQEDEFGVEHPISTLPADRDDSHQVTSDSNNKRQVVALVTQRHSPEAMAQVIEKVQVLGIPVDSKTQALLKKTWMKVMWLTQDCHQGSLHLHLTKTAIKGPFTYT